MAEVISMPRLSDTMEEGTVAKWHKNVGDTVSEGDILAEIETDKAVQEFESEFDGVLLHVGIAEGETTKVDEILAIIGQKDEDISALLSGAATAQVVDDAPATENTNTMSMAAETPAPNAEPVTIPDGVEVITMPRLSDTMEEGTVSKWHKNVGDTVSEGDILAEIETDKAVQEFESEFEGTLLYIGSKEGESSPVDAVLAIIGPAGTDVSGIAANYGKSSADAAPAAAAPAANMTQAESPKAAAPKPAAAPPAKKQNNTDRIFASPLAKKLAEEKGISIDQLVGSGDSGRIVKRDVENYTPTAAGGMGVGAFFPGLEEKEVPNSQIRKIIARRLAESKFSAPHYYLIVEVDMDNAIGTRQQINSLPDTKISFNDMIVKASAMALRKHPQVNSSWTPEATKLHGDINIGVAVAIDEGLLVPVVRNADQKSYTDINAEVKDLAARSRTRTLKADEMEGSTFTVSNLGAYGIEAFTSIINQPNSCILSVGAIVQKPVVREGQIVVGNTMKLTLACDHRTVDGATGSLYLQTLKQYLENPVMMFLG